ncbi:eukaryotic translation initiation factor 3 subunit 6 [Lactarius hengduanensis]|nr:eukaryotic translation initiation factor 3 subunit 6 [Lactarius hengduanensis]
MPVRWFYSYLVLFPSAAICLKDIRYYYFISAGSKLFSCATIATAHKLGPGRFPPWLQQEAKAVLDVSLNPDVAQALRQDKNQNLAYLKDNYDVSDVPRPARLICRFQLRTTYGNYSGAADYLYHFRVLSIDTDLNTSAHWGKLAWDLFTRKWDVALEELNTFRETLDARAGATPLSGAPAQSQGHAEPLATLHSRAWLVHLSLFVHFNHPAGRTLLLETFLAPAYLNTIQSAAPWILRYLAVSAVLSRRAQASGGTAPVSSRVRHAIREVVKVVYHTSCSSRNASSEMIVFLSEFREEFLDNARYLISETYCRIHQRIDTADLSARLNLSPDEGEKWIVNLIRDTRLAADAKIDLEKNVIEIHRPALPISQSVIEKTRRLSIRTQALGAALSRTGQQQAQPAQEQRVLDDENCCVITFVAAE